LDDPGNIYSAPPEQAGGHALTGFPRTGVTAIACAILDLPDPTKSFTTPLNPRRRPLGRRSHEQQFPVRHTTERRER
jgi:hypothetical protein